MNISSIGIGWFFLVLFIINIIATAIIKGTDKYWIASIFLWILLLFSFVLIKQVNDTKIERQEATQTRNTRTDSTRQVINFIELEKVRKHAEDSTDFFINLLGFQAIVSFIWQLIGYGTTRLRYYISSAVIFFVLTIIYLVIEFKDAF